MVCIKRHSHTPVCVTPHVFGVRCIFIFLFVKQFPWRLYLYIKIMDQKIDRTSYRKKNVSNWVSKMQIP